MTAPEVPCHGADANAEPVTGRLNFLGIAIRDFDSAFEFYKNKLGVKVGHLFEGDPLWANMGRTWDEFRADGERGLLWELFGNVPRPEYPNRWGHGQLVRPAITVANIEAARAELEGRGITFTGDVESFPLGRRLEFAAAEGTRWTLSEAKGAAVTDDLAAPRVGLVEVKVPDLDAARLFYGGLMGLQESYADENAVTLGQSGEHAKILLERGETTLPPEPQNDGGSGLALRRHPIWFSFQTADARSAYAHLSGSGATIVEDLTAHADWGGTDFIVADPQGLPMQVVQYGTSADLYLGEAPSEFGTS